LKSCSCEFITFGALPESFEFGEPRWPEHRDNIPGFVPSSPLNCGDREVARRFAGQTADISMGGCYREIMLTQQISTELVIALCIGGSSLLFSMKKESDCSMSISQR